ncbi:MAG TPA: hypothetical protein VJH71_02365 [Candidatus Paceibacterota bacterium]
MKPESSKIKEAVEPLLPRDVVEMYEVSGFQIIGERALRRYKKDKKQDDAIRIKAAEGTQNLYKKSVRASPDERGALLMFALRHDNPDIRRECAQLIYTIPDHEERANLIRVGLEDEDTGVQLVCSRIISFADEREKPMLMQTVSRIVSDGLEGVDVERKKICAEMIEECPPEQEVAFRKKVSGIIRSSFNDGNKELQKSFAQIVKYAAEEDRVDLIMMGLGCDDYEVKSSYADASLASVPDNKQDDTRSKITEIVKSGFDSADKKTQKLSAYMIKNVLEKERFDLVQSCLNNNENDVKMICVEMIPYVVSERQANLMSLALEQGDLTIIWVLLSTLGRFGLLLEAKGGFDEVLKEKIREGIESGDVEKQRIALEMMSFLQVKDEQLIDLIESRGLSGILIEPKLYKHNNVGNKTFERKPFEKDGSETTLLGGTLRSKSIIRHIEPKAFVSWQEAYENYKFWQEQGFDYVPIEPIQSYHLNKDNMVEVYCGVLDISLGDWNLVADRFKRELNDDREKITKLIDELGIEHGHPHVDNFVLRFFRDDDGVPDLKRKPRLYLIDFDQAVSPQPGPGA